MWSRLIFSGYSAQDYNHLFSDRSFLIHPDVKKIIGMTSGSIYRFCIHPANDNFNTWDIVLIRKPEIIFEDLLLDTLYQIKNVFDSEPKLISDNW